MAQLVDSISGTITRSWDDLDRLTSEVTPQGRVDYTYDNAGRRQTMTVLGQPSVTYSWDNADRIQSLTQGSAVVLLGYDDADRRTSVTFPNGLLATYSYNSRDLTGITFTKGGNTLGTLTYTTDADGRRILLDGNWARTGLPGALTSATYNSNNQQVTFGGQTLTYDLNGNLTNDGSNTYTWDARDRLSATSAGTGSFQYDPLGRRTRKVIAGQTTRFHYDGDNPVQELDANGNILANLFIGLGIDEYFVRTDSAGTRALLGDALGSVLALADDAGTVQTTYTYEPFGAATGSGQASTNSYRYTGRENDGTGLSYYRARYYHPGVQRFISEDPIDFLGKSWNLYSYVNSSPLSFIDPLGLKRIPLNDMVALVAGNNRSGFSNALILCLAWWESNHDPAVRHKSKTEVGLLAMTVDASKDAGFDHSALTDPALNIQAGSKYLAIRVKRAKGNIAQGLKGYGTGESYPAKKILDCEKCFQGIPADAAKCPQGLASAGQSCLNKLRLE